MERGTISKPWLNEDNWVTFQIGQCRLHINIQQTKGFYGSLPKISENCLCDYCKYFETEVINHPNRLFEILLKMEVDLTRQPNVNPDGISCVGETRPGRLGYMGNYFVYGRIGKTSKRGKKLSDNHSVTEVSFNDKEFGTNIQVTIKKIEDDILSFVFYLEIDKQLKDVL